MAWTPIVAADVLNEFTPAEKAALNNIQDAGTQLTPILTNVVNAARGAILAGGNQLDQAGLIPDQLREDVIAIARWRWLCSFAQLKIFQTDFRKELFENAMKRMDKVAAGSPKIELPANAIFQAAPDNAVQVASKTCRQAMRHKMKGLI